MEAILGPLPARFVRETHKTKYFWHGQLDWDPDSPDARYVRELRKLKVGRGRQRESGRGRQRASGIG